MDNLRDEAIRWAYDTYDDIMLDMPLFFGFEVMRCNFVIFLWCGVWHRYVLCTLINYL